MSNRTVFSNPVSPVGEPGDDNRTITPTSVPTNWTIIPGEAREHLAMLEADQLSREKATIDRAIDAMNREPNQQAPNQPTLQPHPQPNQQPPSQLPLQPDPPTNQQPPSQLPLQQQPIIKVAQHPPPPFKPLQPFHQVLQATVSPLQFQPPIRQPHPYILPSPQSCPQPMQRPLRPQAKPIPSGHKDMPTPGLPSTMPAAPAHPPKTVSAATLGQAAPVTPPKALGTMAPTTPPKITPAKQQAKLQTMPPAKPPAKPPASSSSSTATMGKSNPAGSTPAPKASICHQKEQTGWKYKAIWLANSHQASRWQQVENLVHQYSQELASQTATSQWASKVVQYCQAYEARNWWQCNQLIDTWMGEPWFRWQAQRATSMEASHGTNFRIPQKYQGQAHWLDFVHKGQWAIPNRTYQF